jgi:phospholipid transport system substrate-binding protein
MMQRVARFGFVLIVGLMCLPPEAGRGGVRPLGRGTAFVVARHLYGELLNVVQNAAALGVKGRYQKLERVVLAAFELLFMTQLSAGPLWPESPREQKQGAWKAFVRFVTATYATQFDDVSGKQFQILCEPQVEHGTLVKTQLVTSDGDKVTINYAGHDNDTFVYLAGTISEFATRRSDFTATLRSGGIEALILPLSKKADALIG